MDVCRRYDLFVHIFNQRTRLSYDFATYSAPKYSKRHYKRRAYSLRRASGNIPFARGYEVLHQLLRSRYGRKNAGGDEDGFVRASRKTAVLVLRQQRNGATYDENDERPFRRKRTRSSRSRKLLYHDVRYARLVCVSLHYKLETLSYRICVFAASFRNRFCVQKEYVKGVQKEQRGNWQYQRHARKQHCRHKSHQSVRQRRIRAGKV